jgi:hypothetical protein
VTARWVVEGSLYFAWVGVEGRAAQLGTPSRRAAGECARSVPPFECARSVPPCPPGGPPHARSYSAQLAARTRWRRVARRAHAAGWGDDFDPVKITPGRLEALAALVDEELLDGRLAALAGRPGAPLAFAVEESRPAGALASGRAGGRACGRVGGLWAAPGSGGWRPPPARGEGRRCPPAPPSPRPLRTLLPPPQPASARFDAPTNTIVFYRSAWAARPAWDCPVQVDGVYATTRRGALFFFRIS